MTEDSLVFLQRAGGALRGVDEVGGDRPGSGGAESRPQAPPPRGRPPRWRSSSATPARRRRPTARRGADARPPGRGGRRQADGLRRRRDVEAGGAKVRCRRGWAPRWPPGPALGARELLPAPTPPPRPRRRVACATRRSPGSRCRRPAPTSSRSAATRAAAPWSSGRWGSPAGVAAGRAAGGALWWRVTARSRSGLDGYPGAARQLAVTAATADAQAPAGTLALAGPQVRVGETLWAGPDARLEMTPANTAEGGGDLAGWRPVINGRKGEAAAAAGPWPPGPTRSVPWRWTAAATAAPSRRSSSPSTRRRPRSPGRCCLGSASRGAVHGRGRRRRAASPGPAARSGSACRGTRRSASPATGRRRSSTLRAPALRSTAARSSSVTATCCACAPRTASRASTTCASVSARAREG